MSLHFEFCNQELEDWFLTVLSAEIVLEGCIATYFKWAGEAFRENSISERSVSVSENKHSLMHFTPVVTTVVKEKYFSDNP